MEPASLSAILIAVGFALVAIGRLIAVFGM